MRRLSMRFFWFILLGYSVSVYCSNKSINGYQASSVSSSSSGTSSGSTSSINHRLAVPASALNQQRYSQYLPPTNTVNAANRNFSSPVPFPNFFQPQFNTVHNGYQGHPIRHYIPPPPPPPPQYLPPNPFYQHQPIYQSPSFNPAYLAQTATPFVYMGPQAYPNGYDINFNGSPMVMRRRTIQDLCQAYAPEEKTVIYVLTMKPGGGYESISIPEPTKPSKPEVFFIKYKTPEDADYAQQHIQAQYDQLGGTSEISNEGLAPVHNVISRVDATGNVTRSLSSASINNGLVNN